MSRLKDLLDHEENWALVIVSITLVVSLMISVFMY
jgi:hypothetical protein